MTVGKTFSFKRRMVHDIKSLLTTNPVPDVNLKEPQESTLCWLVDDAHKGLRGTIPDSCGSEHSPESLASEDNSKWGYEARQDF